MNLTRLSANGRARTWGLAVVLWAFGLATTTLLVGLWGRTVTADRSTLEASGRSAVTSNLVADRIHDWVTDAIVTASVSADGPDRAAIEAVVGSAAADVVVDRLIADVVTAAMAPPGTEPEIDIGATVAPLIPVVIAELEAGGLEIPDDEVRRVVDQAAAVVLDSEEPAYFIGAARRAHTFLTTVLVVGLAAMILSGSIAVALAEDHVAMVRSLAIRLAVSAITFTIFLRIGAWAIDPGRGRSPLAAGGSVLLGSNHLALLMVTMAASAVALAAGIAIRRRRVATYTVTSDAPQPRTLEPV